MLADIDFTIRYRWRSLPEVHEPAILTTRYRMGSIDVEHCPTYSKYIYPEIVLLSG
jgi:hypothetical protein